MPRERAKFTKVRPVDPDAPEALWRLFVGFDFPESHRTQLDKLLGIVRAADLPIRWIAANTAHMTLHFIGEIPVETAELLRLAFSQATRGMRPFELRVDGAGAFPNLDKPQVVWLGLAGDIASLRRLHRATETFLLKYEIPTEEREFKPHITLGRARQSLQPNQIKELIQLMRSPEVKNLLAELEVDFPVGSITLYRSHLSHEGATHEPIAVAPIA
jgi:2'-5' RNA ligase